MEIWKDIQGYKELYQVSNFARIKSLPKCTGNGKGYLTKETIRIPELNHNGYFRVILYKDGIGKHYSIHRLMAIEFILNPKNKPQINHKNGIKTDNRINNLEWVTASENQLHSYANGLQKPQKGEGIGTSKLRTVEVLEIRSQKGKAKQKELAKKYNVAQQTISKIMLQKRWNHL